MLGTALVSCNNRPLCLDMPSSDVRNIYHHVLMGMPMLEAPWHHLGTSMTPIKPSIQHILTEQSCISTAFMADQGNMVMGMLTGLCCRLLTISARAAFNQGIQCTAHAEALIDIVFMVGLPATTLTAMNLGLAQALQCINASAFSPPNNGPTEWSSSIGTGSYGTNPPEYILRAAVAEVGLGANPPQEVRHNPLLCSSMDPGSAVLTCTPAHAGIALGLRGPTLPAFNVYQLLLASYTMISISPEIKQVDPDPADLCRHHIFSLQTFSPQGT